MALKCESPEVLGKLWCLRGWHGDGDLSAEFFYLVDQPGDLLLGALAADGPIWPEVDVVNVVMDDVPVGDEDVVAGCTNGFEGAAATSDRMEMCG